MVLAYTLRCMRLMTEDFYQDFYLEEYHRNKVTDRLVWAVVGYLLLMSLLLHAVFPATYALGDANPAQPISMQTVSPDWLPPEDFIEQFRFVKRSYEQCVQEFSLGEERCQEMKAELINLASPRA